VAATTSTTPLGTTLPPPTTPTSPATG
jgi:hypothetical protein